MSFSQYSVEFRYLLNKWENYIMERTDCLLMDFEEEYESLTVEERNTNPIYNETDFYKFCNDGAEFHQLAFNEERDFHFEEDILSMIDTPKELLYILQYVDNKNAEYGTGNISVNDMTGNMNLFIFYLSLDIIHYTIPSFVGRVLSFIQIFEDKRTQRKIAAAIICKRTDGFDGNILSNIISFMK